MYELDTLWRVATCSPYYARSACISAARTGKTANTSVVGRIYEVYVVPMSHGGEGFFHIMNDVRLA